MKFLDGHPAGQVACKTFVKPCSIFLSMMCDLGQTAGIETGGLRHGGQSGWRFNLLDRSSSVCFKLRLRINSETLRKLITANLVILNLESPVKTSPDIHRN